MTSSLSLERILRLSPPLAIVFYEQSAERDRWIETSAREISGTRTDRIEDIFARVDDVLFVTPADEVGAIVELNGRRDAMLERSKPAILFLLREGAAADRLRDAPSLASWVQGAEIETRDEQPTAPSAGRDAFEHEAKMSPEAWLNEYRSGALPDSFENRILFHRALLLERS